MLLLSKELWAHPSKVSDVGGKSGFLREVLFRFGNWCYNGHVDLGEKLQLSDIPVIIPMLRRQQSALVNPSTSALHIALECKRNWQLMRSSWLLF